MVISRGDTHDFLGTTIKIRKGKKVEITTKHKIEDTVSQFKDICDFKVTLPCAHNLWDINDEAKFLDDIKADFSLVNSQVTIYYKEEKTRYITRCDIIDHTD